MTLTLWEREKLLADLEGMQRVTIRVSTVAEREGWDEARRLAEAALDLARDIEEEVKEALAE